MKRKEITSRLSFSIPCQKYERKSVEPTFVLSLPLTHSQSLYLILDFSISPHRHACCMQASIHTHTNTRSIFTTDIRPFVHTINGESYSVYTYIKQHILYRYFIIQSSKFSNAYFIRFQTSVPVFSLRIPLF